MSIFKEESIELDYDDITHYINEYKRLGESDLRDDLHEVQLSYSQVDSIIEQITDNIPQFSVNS